MFLSGAFVAVWAAGALAQVPFEGGTWSFSWVIRSKSCDFSRRLAAEHRAGCFTDMTPLKESATLNIRPGELPTVGPLWPCRLPREERARLVHYVASRTHPRRFVLAIGDRAAVIEAFVSCGLPESPLDGYRLNRWSSIVTVFANGQRVRPHEVLWDSFDIGDGRRARSRATAIVRGRRTGDVATGASVGEDPSGIAN